VKLDLTNQIKKLLKSSIKKSIAQEQISVTEVPELILLATKNKTHGDIATNIALQLSRKLKINPMIIAQYIVDNIDKDNLVIEKIEIAKPGFINFWFKNDWLYQIINEIRTKGNDYGKVDIGKGKRIQIEFVSVNPTGPLHVGHGKCAAVGDALSRILKAAGFYVEKEYYINDQGKQIDILGKSVQARYNDLLGEEVEFPSDGYKGSYIIDIAQEIVDLHGNRFMGSNCAEAQEFFKDFTLKKISNEIKKDLERFGVSFDVWFSEKSLYEKGRLQEILKILEQKDMVYKEKGAVWLKTSKFDDEKDRVVIRENGIPTYFASDIAYHQDKHQRGFDKVIDVWGADHHGYIDRMKAAMRALGYPPEFFDVLIVQFVTLIKEGKEVGMSTREGEFVTLRDLINEVGKDVARYFFLMRSYDSHTEFDLDIAKSESMENPVYYIQYAYARICSILRKAEEAGIKINENDQVDLNLLNADEELALIKKLSVLKDVLKRSAVSWKPHLLTTYLYDLASTFHKYYTVHRIIVDDISLSKSRLMLIDSTRIVLNNTLNLLGISSPESM